MPIPTLQRPQRQAPRTSFPEITHAVIRSDNGARVQGRLQIISLTGGLLGLPKPLDRGSQVKLMFLTDKGSVFGAAGNAASHLLDSAAFQIHQAPQRRPQKAASRHSIVIGSRPPRLRRDGKIPSVVIIAAAFLRISYEAAISESPQASLSPLSRPRRQSAHRQSGSSHHRQS
jgi:hypothetical protein